jgi:hypothetical protein
VIEEFLAWLVSKAPLVTALAAATGAVIAVLGYRKWLPESVGKRKIELAEDILADMYEAREVFAWARFPGGYGAEGTSRPTLREESDHERELKNAYARTIERLNKENELWGRIQSRKYRAMAYFGDAGGVPMLEIKKIVGDIRTAAQMLISHFGESGFDPNLKKVLLAKIGWSEEPEGEDSVGNRVEATIKGAEELFGKYLLRKSNR